MKNKNNFLGSLDFIKNAIRACAAAPCVVLTFHFLNISEIRIYWQKMNYLKNNLDVTPRHFLQSFKNTGVNA